MKLSQKQKEYLLWSATEIFNIAFKAGELNTTDWTVGLENEPALANALIDVETWINQKSFPSTATSLHVQILENAVEHHFKWNEVVANEEDKQYLGLHILGVRRAIAKALNKKIELWKNEISENA